MVKFLSLKKLIKNVIELIFLSIKIKLQENNVTDAGHNN